MTKLFILVPFM